MTDKMIGLLSQHQNPANDYKLQHAILGALRNLAVTAQARQFLIEKGSTDARNKIGIRHLKFQFELVA